MRSAVVRVSALVYAVCGDFWCTLKLACRSFGVSHRVANCFKLCVRQLSCCLRNHSLEQSSNTLLRTSLRRAPTGNSLATADFHVHRRS
jgi:hypothetical protein